MAEPPSRAFFVCKVFFAKHWHFWDFTVGLLDMVLFMLFYIFITAKKVSIMTTLNPEARSGFSMMTCQSHSRRLKLQALVCRVPAHSKMKAEFSRPPYQEPFQL